MLDIVSFGGKLGVNCFVLITGYFMVALKFKTLSFLKTLLQTLFYSMLIFVCFSIYDPAEAAHLDPIRYLIPSTSGLYWFASCYLALYLITPMLNRLIQLLTQRQLASICIISFCGLSLIPTVTTFNPVGSNFLWFIVLYFIGGYIRLFFSNGSAFHSVIDLLNPVRLVQRVGAPLVFCISVLIIWGYAASSNYLNALCGADTNPRYLMNQNSLPILYASISLFVIFKQANVPTNKAINGLATTAFGVYLIHDNPIIRGHLWKHFDFLYNYDPAFLLLAACCIVVAVFASCSLIDLMRIHLLEKPFFAFLKKRDFFQKIDRAINLEL